MTNDTPLPALVRVVRRWVVHHRDVAPLGAVVSTYRLRPQDVRRALAHGFVVAVETGART